MPDIHVHRFDTDIQHSKTVLRAKQCLVVPLNVYVYAKSPNVMSSNMAATGGARCQRK